MEFSNNPLLTSRVPRTNKGVSEAVIKNKIFIFVFCVKVRLWGLMSRDSRWVPAVCLFLIIFSSCCSLELWAYNNVSLSTSIFISGFYFGTYHFRFFHHSIMLGSFHMHLFLLTLLSSYFQFYLTVQSCLDLGSCWIISILMFLLPCLLIFNWVFPL